MRDMRLEVIILKKLWMVPFLIFVVNRELIESLQLQKNSGLSLIDKKIKMSKSVVD